MTQVGPLSSCLTRHDGTFRRPNKKEHNTFCSICYNQDLRLSMGCRSFWIRPSCGCHGCFSRAEVGTPYGLGDGARAGLVPTGPNSSCENPPCTHLRRNPFPPSAAPRPGPHDPIPRLPIPRSRPSAISSRRCFVASSPCELPGPRTAGLALIPVPRSTRLRSSIPQFHRVHGTRLGPFVPSSLRSDQGAGTQGVLGNRSIACRAQGCSGLFKFAVAPKRMNSPTGPTRVENTDH